MREEAGKLSIYRAVDNARKSIGYQIYRAMQPPSPLGAAVMRQVDSLPGVQKINNRPGWGYHESRNG